MTTSETTTSEGKNLAHVLRYPGRSGGFIRIVKEVVGEYLGIHSNLSPETLERLAQVNRELTTITAANDSIHEQRKTGTHSESKNL